MKNKICKGIVLALPIICLAVFSACKDPMKDYYDNGSYTGVGTETTLDLLKSNPEYSTFVLFLEETGMAEMLDGDNVLTVWVPRNVDMPSEMAHLDADQKARFVENHLSLGAITTSDLSLYTRVATLSGRNLSVSVNNGVYSLNNAALVKTNMMCKNGVIQEISTWFVPRLTLYEMLETLPGEYSIFRDSMLGRTVKVFDLENSIPIATDENGGPIYDTAWLYENEILDVSDISDAGEIFTFFVPTNDAMLGMYSEMTNYLNAAQHPITSEDTSKWVDWVLKSIIIPGQWPYQQNATITSRYWGPEYTYIEIPMGENSFMRFGEPTLYYEINTRYQIIYNQTPKQYANGWVYDINVLRVPKTLYMPLVASNPWSIRTYANSVAAADPWAPTELDSWTEPVDYDNSVISDAIRRTIRMQFGREGRREDGSIKAEYSFQTVVEQKEPNPDDPDNSDSDITTVVPLNFMPGNYLILTQLYNSNILGNDSRLDSLQLIINGEPIVVRRILRGTYTGTLGGQIGDDSYYIPGTYAPAEVTYSLFPLDTSNSPEVEEELESDPDLYRAYRRIEMGMLIMVPDPENNY